MKYRDLVTGISSTNTGETALIPVTLKAGTILFRFVFMGTRKRSSQP